MHTLHKDKNKFIQFLTTLIRIFIMVMDQFSLWVFRYTNRISALMMAWIFLTILGFGFLAWIFVILWIIGAVKRFKNNRRS